MNQPNAPYIRSRVNGILIPLHPSQVGIMHRFNGAENQVVISEVNPHGGNPDSEKGATLQVPATPDPATVTAQQQPAQQPAAIETPDAPAKKKKGSRAVPPVNTVPVL